MQAIRTRYHGPTNTRGSRISAQCEAGRVYVGYDPSLSIEDNHLAACDSLRQKLDWTAPHYGPMSAGCFGGDFYWVHVDIPAPWDGIEFLGRSPISWGKLCA